MVIIGLADSDQALYATEEEIKAMYDLAGVEISDKELDAFMKEADFDDNGEISVWEFEQWYND